MACGAAPRRAACYGQPRTPNSHPPRRAQHDTLHDRIVAIKRVRKVSFKDGINLGAVKELQALSELDHANVLKLFDAFVYGDRIHLVLEYCPADLSALIRDRCVAGAARGGCVSTSARSASNQSRHPIHTVYAARSPSPRRTSSA